MKRDKEVLILLISSSDTASYFTPSVGNVFIVGRQYKEILGDGQLEMSLETSLSLIFNINDINATL